MAKRKDPRRRRPDGAKTPEGLRRGTDSASPGDGPDRAHAMEADGSSAAMQSFAEYLSFRNAIIGLAVIQFLVIVILAPLHYHHHLQTGATVGMEERDYARAYNSLRRLDFWFGRHPDKFHPNEFVPSLIPNQRRLPSTTLRYWIDGAWSLIEMDRPEEAAALLDRISPEAEEMTYYQRNRWKVYFLQGRLLRAQGDHDGALEKFSQALTLNRNQPDLNFYVGQMLAEKGEDLEAAFYLSQAVRNPTFAEPARELLDAIRDRITL